MPKTRKIDVGPRPALPDFARLRRVDGYLYALFLARPTCQEVDLRLRKRWQPNRDPDAGQPTYFPDPPIGVLAAFDRRHPGVMQAAPIPCNRYADRVRPAIDALNAAAAIEAVLRSNATPSKT